MRRRFLSLLTLALLTVGLASRSLMAQCASTFPANYIPFSNIYYISLPDAAGDRLVVGSMTPAAFEAIQTIPLPNVTNQQFCNPVSLAATLTAQAYVPTPAERAGDFSAFAGLLIDPTTGLPFAEGLIPLTSIPNVFAWRVTSVQPLVGPPVFASTFTGHQVLSVDTTSGSVTTLNTDSSASPEDMTVGPDGKIYVCDPLNNRVRRMNQDGSQVEIVYSGTNPTGPEGPSFSGNDLFFNTRAPSSGVWEIAGVGAIPFAGTFPAPTNVIPATCAEASTLCTNSTFGEGTAVETFVPVLGKLLAPTSKRSPGIQYAALGKRFSSFPGLLASATETKGIMRSRSALTSAFLAADPNLLIVDRSTPAILDWSIGSSTVSTLATNDTCLTAEMGPCLDVPIGIAVNNTTGDIYVGNLGSSATTGGVSHFDTFGNFLGTLASSATPNGFGIGDRPGFLELDSLGNLLVATSQVAFNISGNATGESTGKVWRVDPVSGKATLLTMLTCAAPSCPPPPVVGVAVPGSSISQSLNPGGGQNNYIFGSYNFKVQYPADPSFAGETLTVSNLLTAQSQLASLTGSGPFSGALIVPYDGASGKGVTFETTCLNSTGGSCAPFTEGYKVFTSYNGSVPDNPAFLKKPDAASIYNTSPPLPPGNGNILDNFYIQRIDPTGSGRTCCGYSDYIIVDLPPGPTTAAAFNGFLPPLAPRNGRVFRAGETIAVKFTLTGLSPLFDPTQVVARISVELMATAQGTPAANFKAIPNNQFIFLKGTYQFFLNTTGYAPGSYLLIVTSNSFPTQSVNFKID